MQTEISQFWRLVKVFIESGQDRNQLKSDSKTCLVQLQLRISRSATFPGKHGTDISLSPETKFFFFQKKVLLEHKQSFFQRLFYNQSNIYLLRARRRQSTVVAFLLLPKVHERCGKIEPIYQCFSEGFGKCSWRQRPELSTTKNMLGSSAKNYLD